MTCPAGTFAYADDGDGRMIGLTDPYGNTGNWTYYANNWLASQASGTGAGTTATATYAYNGLGELTNLLNQSGAGATLSHFSGLAYDGAGNRTAATAAIAGSASYSGTTTFSYEDNAAHDAQSRLTGEASTRLGGYSQNHAYDAAGNPTTFKSVTGLSYNADNQLASNAYDGNGNASVYAGTAASYDPENRLIGFGTAMSASYNGDGLRASKTGAAGTTYYLYDGTDPVCELDGRGNVSALNVFGANGLVCRTAATSDGPSTTF